MPKGVEHDFREELLRIANLGEQIFDAERR